MLGTTKGVVLIFDYQQIHKAVIGLGSKAVEAGPVTSLAISADHTTVAAGHANGDIFTWDLSRPARPFLHIQPLDLVSSPARKGDGHVAGAAVLHVGFLGTRHTALVSADDRGMAFSHLASRGMGVVARTIRTTRILGRYPDALTRGSKSRKPSSVLAFSPLPLGNIEQSTDSLGLVAMLTPYLLVIVSTTPVAQTQHKAARPKEVEAHGAMSAALAWFPAIKVKARDATVSKTKLVYCWSNVLTVLEVDEAESSEPVDKDRPPNLEFRTRSRWTSEEAIVAVQWLSRSILSVLTITQQLLILDAKSMRVTDSFDLVQKHVYHADLFSNQLNALVEQFDEEDPSMHGVVADAFYMSFRSYKGKLLLGHNDVSIGSLSNWADRVLALMETGDFIGAIRLATFYHSGEGEWLSIGLPEEAEARQSIVREKLLEMMSASVKYAFGKNQEASDERLEKTQLEELAAACIGACIGMHANDFLFDEVYSWYEDFGMQNAFLDVLEPYIISGEATSLPPAVVKALINYFITNHTPSRLEEIICLLDTSTMDIDQVTTFCKERNLYDAFIYVWNRAIGDYTGPMEELLVKTQTLEQVNGDVGKHVMDFNNAMKVFPYLSYILTGRIYPTGEQMTDTESRNGKTQIYTFLFSGGNDATLKAGRKDRRGGSKPDPKPSFSHLRTILLFDTSSFMSVLNEAFEDSFLNEGSDSNGVSRASFNNAATHTSSVNRQYIIRILLEVMADADFDRENTIYLDMFIARNIPKYPQYILLSGSTLHQILVRLCEPPSPEVAEDCQLSVEYLFSTYRPPDIQTLIPLFKEAKYFRVLKTTYRVEGQFAQLVEAYFEDNQDQEEVYDCIRMCFSATTNLNSKRLQDLRSVIEAHASKLLAIDVGRTASIIDEVASDLHQVFLDVLEDDPECQYRYLGTILEPEAKGFEDAVSSETGSKSGFIERYVRLMCQYRPTQVADYVESTRVTDLRLNEVLPAMELNGIIDAAVILLARQGQVQDGMERLIRHLGKLESVLNGIVKSTDTSPDFGNTDEAVGDLLDSLTQYSMIGVWLCQGQTKSANKSRGMIKSGKRGSTTAQQPLSFEENLWLDLVDAVVSIARNISPAMAGKAALRTPEARPTTEQEEKVSLSLRSLVQRVFTALLTATTTRERSGERTDFSFLRILRAFLTRAAAASPSLAELRAVIASIFSAYAYEESLLELTTSMLDKDLFVHVDEIASLRQRGWRPRGQICAACRRRVWGPGAGGQIWEAWQSKASADDRRREEQQRESGDESRPRSRGKGKATDPRHEVVAGATAAGDGNTPGPEDRGDLGPIVVFSCRHLYHHRCLSKSPTVSEKGARTLHEEGLSCPACASRVPA